MNVCHRYIVGIETGGNKKTGLQGLFSYHTNKLEAFKISVSLWQQLQLHP